ncbi:MAG: hypothetical protein HFJ35_03420 [Clostridia bacterium]|nr:hypothetical protein [Clostridia bacterium]
MNWKSEKGYTGIDIATSVVVLFIFISLIASLSYRFNRSAKEIELKAQAIDIAVSEMENKKNTLDFDKIKNIGNNSEEEYQNDGKTIDSKFLKKVLVQDYASIVSGKNSGLVKKVTVEISYYFGKERQQIRLSTIVSKES